MSMLICLWKLFGGLAEKKFSLPCTALHSWILFCAYQLLLLRLSTLETISIDLKMTLENLANSLPLSTPYSFWDVTSLSKQSSKWVQQMYNPTNYFLSHCRSYKGTIKSLQKFQQTIKQNAVVWGRKPKLWTAVSQPLWVSPWRASGQF